MKTLIEMNKNLRIFTLLSCFFILTFVGLVNRSLSLASVGFAFLILLMYTNSKYENTSKAKLEQDFKNIIVTNNYDQSLSFLADDYLTGVVIDVDNNKVVLLERTNITEQMQSRVVKFKDIVESSISQNGESLITTSRGGQVAGALVGGMLAGGVGAVIGGLSGNKTSTEKINKLTLSIVVDDLLNPVFNINFLNSPTSVSELDERYVNLYNTANKFHKTISVIINRNNTNAATI